MSAWNWWWLLETGASTEENRTEGNKRADPDEPPWSILIQLCLKQAYNPLANSFSEYISRESCKPLLFLSVIW